MKAEELREALGEWIKVLPTEGYYSDQHYSGVPAVRLARIHDDGGAQEVESLMLDEAGIERLLRMITVVRSYLSLLEKSDETLGRMVVAIYDKDREIPDGTRGKTYELARVALAAAMEDGDD